jgi:hypothetical protein
VSKYGKQIDRDGVPSVEPEQGYRNTDYTADTNSFIDNTSPTAEEMGKTIRANQFAADMWEIFDSAGNLLLKKHKDYGPTNISRSPGGPLNGLRVRMWDKTARLNHLIDSGATPENESLRDSFLDLLNYSAIALMVLDGKWPND